MTPAFIRATLELNRREAERLIELCLPPDWPGAAANVLSLRLKQLEAEPALQPWLLRAIALRSTAVMVGYIGFHTSPGPEYLQELCPSGVEFGFTVFPAFRRQGYAREAALALMNWARDTHDVTQFVLCIRPDNVGSQALAAQLGFVRIGSHLDEVDGVEDILKYSVPSG